jgi:hypothetical protein
MALTFATHAVPGPWWAQRVLAVAGVCGLAALNYRGVTKTAMAARVLVAATLVALVMVVIGIAVARGARLGHLGLPANVHGGVYGVLQSAGLLFFAFAGYARIATMGEEVRDPERTIPRAQGIGEPEHRHGRRGEHHGESEDEQRSSARHSPPTADPEGRPSTVLTGGGVAPTRPAR